MSRIGNTYGSLTVLEDRGGLLLCRCSCGREGLYSSGISKPTYKGRRKCAYCAGRPCEVCGAWMPAKPGDAGRDVLGCLPQDPRCTFGV